MALILGLLLHSWCSLLAWIVPYFIFIILLLNFVAVDLRKLHISSMNLWLMLFQIVVSIGGYYTIRSVYPNETVAQGILIGILCPVAASVVVITRNNSKYILKIQKKMLQIYPYNLPRTITGLIA